MNINRVRAWALPFVLAALAVPALAAARPTPTPAPTPAPVADPAITKIAKQQFVAWQAGSVNQALYAPEVLAKLTQDKVDQTAKALSGLGPLTDTVYIGPFSAPDIPPDAKGYIYQMRCSEGNVYLWLILNTNGKIATIFFKDKLDVETVERPGAPGASPGGSPPPR
ncbi:MAG TPA: hypothetical protein VGF18_06850 [Candidatus Tumulicola sp.]